MNEYTERASAALERPNCDPKRLIFLHAGAIAAFSLIASLLDYYLAQKVGTTGGLSGMGTRAILNTARRALTLLLTVFRPFWDMGIFYIGLRILRGEGADDRSLLQGFRSAPAVIGKLLLESLNYLGVMMIASFLSMQLILSFTPYGKELMAFAVPLLENGLTEEAVAAISELVSPLSTISSICGALAVLAYSYRYRMASFRVMDMPQDGGRLALYNSKVVMKGHKWELFRLDLHFWWYYLPLALLVALGYGDVILVRVGITLPLSADVQFMIFNALYLIGMFGLAVVAKNYVTVAYAAFYEARFTVPEE